MTGAFTIVVIAVAVIGVLGALAAILSGRRTWEAYGRDHLMLDSDPRAPAREAPPVAARTGASAERDAEIRQLLEARNRRRRRRGEPALDVEAEFARLTASGPSPRAPRAGAEGVDAALRAEIRELVIARNHRRVRRGRPPLDVAAELEREIARLTR